jgi:hypothetical protein
MSLREKLNQKAKTFKVLYDEQQNHWKNGRYEACDKIINSQLLTLEQSEEGVREWLLNQKSHVEGSHIDTVIDKLIERIDGKFLPNKKSG